MIISIVYSSVIQIKVKIIYSWADSSIQKLSIVVEPQFRLVILNLKVMTILSVLWYLFFLCSHHLLAVKDPLMFTNGVLKAFSIQHSTPLYLQSEFTLKEYVTGLKAFEREEGTSFIAWDCYMHSLSSSWDITRWGLSQRLGIMVVVKSTENLVAKLIPVSSNTGELLWIRWRMVVVRSVVENSQVGWISRRPFHPLLCLALLVSALEVAPAHEIMELKAAETFQSS